MLYCPSTTPWRSATRLSIPLSRYISNNIWVRPHGWGSSLDVLSPLPIHSSSLFDCRMFRFSSVLFAVSHSYVPVAKHSIAFELTHTSPTVQSELSDTPCDNTCGSSFSMNPCRPLLGRRRRRPNLLIFQLPSLQGVKHKDRPIWINCQSSDTSSPIVTNLLFPPDVSMTTYQVSSGQPAYNAPPRRLWWHVRSLRIVRITSKRLGFTNGKPKGNDPCCRYIWKSIVTWGLI